MTPQDRNRLRGTRNIHSRVIARNSGEYHAMFLSVTDPDDKGRTLHLDIACSRDGSEYMHTANITHTTFRTSMYDAILPEITKALDHLDDPDALDDCLFHAGRAIKFMVNREGDAG